MRRALIWARSGTFAIHFRASVRPLRAELLRQLMPAKVVTGNQADADLLIPQAPAEWPPEFPIDEHAAL